MTYSASSVPFVVAAQDTCAAPRGGEAPRARGPPARRDSRARLQRGSRGIDRRADARHSPVIVSEHSSHFLMHTLTRADRLRARLVFRNADLVCPVSDYLRAAIEEAWDAWRTSASCRTSSTPSFSRHGLTAPGRGADGRARVLVVAGLHPVKGVATLLRAVATRRRSATTSASTSLATGRSVTCARRSSPTSARVAVSRYMAGGPTEVADALRARASSCCPAVPRCSASRDRGARRRPAGLRSPGRRAAGGPRRAHRRADRRGDGGGARRRPAHDA